nr:hypothetical protein [Tanacetum cinerariifolium]
MRNLTGSLVRLRSTNRSNNRLNDGSKNGLRIKDWRFRLENQRLDVFGASVVSRMHRVHSRLGLKFYYRRKRRRSSRNRGSLICSSTTSGDTLQFLLRLQLEVGESRVDEPDLGKLKLDKLEVGFDHG